jgi:hypothetical protein
MRFLLNNTDKILLINVCISALAPADYPGKVEWLFVRINEKTAGWVREDDFNKLGLDAAQ